MKSVGGYTLRGSVALTTAIAKSALADYGIKPAARRALLNVDVLKSEKRGVRADAESDGSPLAGAKRTFDLRSVTANGRTSYGRVFEHAASEVLNFEIVAVPTGTDERIVLRDRD